MGRLEGRVALVTGASRGIGQAIATRFAAEGARVACVARTLREGESSAGGSLERTVAQVRAHGGEATAIVANLTEESDCARAVSQTEATYGPVDVLINNAAITYPASILETPPRRWYRMFELNVHAPFWLSQGVLPGMMARGRGAIVNVSSSVAVGPGRGPYSGELPALLQTPYGATKAALERFTQGLAQELQEYGVTVAAVSPSQVVLTEGVAYLFAERGISTDSTEPVDYMVEVALLLATEPPARVSGRVTYSQQLLAEYGRLADPRGPGVEWTGSGFSER